MMRAIGLTVELPFGSSAEADQSERVLLLLLGAVAHQNQRYLIANPDTKPLYESGIRYAPPDQVTEQALSKKLMEKIVGLVVGAGLNRATITAVAGLLTRVGSEERMNDIPTVYRRGAADCNDLVCIRLGELWRSGIMAGPYLEKQAPSGRVLVYHALVQHPDGSKEDPSLILGMDGDRAKAEREAEQQKNYARQSAIVGATIAAGKDPREVHRRVRLTGFVPDGGFR